MCGIKSAITSKMNSFNTQTFSENDLSELSVVARAHKHLKVALASSNMKSSILPEARLNQGLQNEWLTQKHSSLLNKFHVIKKYNPAIGSVIDFSINLLSMENRHQSQRTPTPFRMKINNCKLIDWVIRIEFT